MAATPHDASGTTVVFKGTTFTVTNVTLNYAEVTDVIDISHLGQTTGEVMKTQARPLLDAFGATGAEVSFDYIGTNALAGGASGAFSVTGFFTGATATIASSSITLAMNDAIRGNATVRVKLS